VPNDGGHFDVGATRGSPPGDEVAPKFRGPRTHSRKPEAAQVFGWWAADDAPTIIGDPHHEVSASAVEDHLDVACPAVLDSVDDGLARDPNEVLAVFGIELLEFIVLVGLRPHVDLDLIERLELPGHLLKCGLEAGRV
jgi:hypothetical protein